ncbi:MAG TPA: SRPBCC family protein [Casimicrobiaceae bacterium]|nr:SRPBCC family protein [Casimicrobiaceae bacterium]
MKVELAKTFPLPAAPDAAWTLLQDVEAVASCMPGAKITQRIDDTHYKGTVTVRVGPATLSFRGDIEVKEIDAATRTLRLVGSGSDTTGSSAGSMDLTARIDASEDGRSTLNGQSVVSLSGKAAAFGGRMVNTVADQILGQFAGNFAARLPDAAARSTSAAITSASTTSTSAGAAAPSAGGSTAAPASEAVTAASAPPPAAELNGLALLWAVIRDWLRGLFAGKRA